MSALAVIGVVAALASAAAAGFIVGWRRWKREQAELARVRATFARYVAPSIVEDILARGDERLFSGRRMRVTVLVCRIRNFAHFTEELAPEETLRYLNEFYALSGTAIARHRGIIENFLGDGVVAAFGAPLENPTQEDDALRAALDIVRQTVAMRERWSREGRRPFTIGIGVNSGDAIAGDTGYRDRREYAVVGSEATFAHRLQEAAFSLNAYIVASRRTCESLGDEYQLVPVSGIPLPGVRRLLDAFVVRGRRQGAERFSVPVDALVETTIEPDAHEVPAAPVLPATVAVAASPPSPAAPPEPPLARPVRERATARSFDLPELRTAFDIPPYDEGPIMPDPPPPKAFYEDRAGSIDL